MHKNCTRPMRALTAVLTAGGALALAGCADSTNDESLNTKPGWLGTISTTSHDAAADDLLTAGLGKTGLQSAVAPAFAVPDTPTAAELRRLAIYTNYRALADMTPNGGYGRFYGPNIDLAGNDTLGEGKIAGTEYLAYVDDGSGRENVTVMVQVPAGFDPNHPCIVAAPSSGSRGIYGAIGTTGEWGLKRGCAVAYTDKGTGNGAHDLTRDKVTQIDGRLATSTAAGKNAQFAVPLSSAELNAYNASHPNRYAFKHAHSQRNPEKDWGLYTLRSIEFAFYVLNETYGTTAPEQTSRKKTIVPTNTVVIASSVSNGGGAALAAAEEDTRGLIDAVVVSEPQINFTLPAAVTVKRGTTSFANIGKPLYDYITYANLYEPCAAVAPSNAASPMLSFLNATAAANRCTALKNAGLLTAATTETQAEEAKSLLQAYGWETDGDLFHASHYAFGVAPAVSTTYAYAYARARISDDLCGYSMGTTDMTGAPFAPVADPMLKIFSVGNGVPPTSGINLIAENAANGPRNYTAAVSASTGLVDYHYDGAKCLRDKLADAAVAVGIGQVKKTANLRGKPTIVVHGRSDTLIPVNHSSRPYLGMNSLAEGNASKLRYIEVTNAQHFEAFLPLPGYDTRLVPLHVYGTQALNLMWAHLTAGGPLPGSQVVHTVPRGGTPGAAPALAAFNVPPIATTPAAANAITVNAGAVLIPD